MRTLVGIVVMLLCAIDAQAAPENCVVQSTFGGRGAGAVVYDGPLIEDTYHSNAADYLSSMERLLTLPVRLVHGGHFPSFSGERYRELITGWLDAKHKTI